MRIVIDLQGAQSSGSRNRGIGRYSTAMALAIIRNRGNHEIFIALNGLFSDTIEPIRAEFDGHISQENIRVWHVPGPVFYLDHNNDWRRKTAELVREAFLASLKPDFIYVTSLFEGLGDDAVTSVNQLAFTIPTAVTLFDLIPLIYRKTYLGNPEVELWYENKLDQLRRADLLLAISESSRQESIVWLGFPDEKTVNVGTAADPQFKRNTLSEAKKQTVRKLYGLTKPFVMYTGGIDHRKNIEGLIRAFALLPSPIRNNHQLAIVCSVNPQARNSLETLINEVGLDNAHVILTGYVSEDDLISLYHLCKAFIFPSWHEGFGLPALEAMSCGAPTIAANTSSLPEVIGRQDSLFDPFVDKEIAAKIEHVLTDDKYRAELISHGLQQAGKFSWDKCAQRAIAAFEQSYKEKNNLQPLLNRPLRRPKLAYVSPLPPERSGISDYSAELLPELSRHYDIDVIVAQESVSDAWVRANCHIHDAKWLLNNSRMYERVLYHFGNSGFHQHMFELLSKVPGVIVLHDFFISGIVAHMDVHGINSGFWVRELYQAYGYKAVQERYHTKDTADVIWKYPCNKLVVEKSLGVIVHSNNSNRLARLWFEENKNWPVIPLLRVPVQNPIKTEARKLLGLNYDDFVVCSFGIMGPAKLNKQLLDAWLASQLGKNKKCRLIFVGENNEGEYGKDMLNTLNSAGINEQISITGWLESTVFRQYLAAADIAVQLRTLSRGETSAAVLDCMNYGLPTIINANGSMADLPNNAVLMLADEFSTKDLTQALETLFNDGQKRNDISAKARQVVLTMHSPRACSNLYADAIETYYEASQVSTNGLINALANFKNRTKTDPDLLSLAKSIALNHQPPVIKQLLVDISELVNCDAKTGIQRVVRSVLLELLANPPAGYRVEPIYANLHEPGYRYAREFILNFLDCPKLVLQDEIVETFNGDIFLGLDLQPHIVTNQAAFYKHLRCIGVRTYFVVYDLLPITFPHFFPEGTKEAFDCWLATLSESNGCLCISRTVADEVTDWLSVYGPKRLRPFKIGWFHLGADLIKSAPTMGLSTDLNNIIKSLCNSHSFLMVGTVEPRKGHLQTVAAFELLWDQGVDVNLVIVGKQGWNMDGFIESIQRHPEFNNRLFWFKNISDESLEKVYTASTCLIASSEGEGFGLPLIEAAHHKIPIIARDIPVFREVAGEHAFFFTGLEPDSLADAIKEWLKCNKTGNVPRSSNIPWISWKQSTQCLLDIIFSDKCYRQWMPDNVL